MFTTVRHRVVLLAAISLILAAGAPAGATGRPAPADRESAAANSTHLNATRVRTADLGEVDLGPLPGQYRVPARGTLVTPAAKGPSQSALVVLAHLRFPNCAGNTFAYPCPKGKKERRLDRGMTYLGTALARRGYSVLIPDLGPLFVGADLTDPYDQPAGVQQVLGKLIDSAVAASAGERTPWGRGLRGDIDTSHVGLLAHSRSAAVAGDLTRAWSRTSHPITSIMTYGGAYESAYNGEPGTSPMAPNVPYLGVVGDQDRDTAYMAPKWLTHHLGVRRTAPALVAVVPGFGHTFINRTLSSAGIDDRICATECPDAAAHETFLTETSTEWFDATLRHLTTSMPLHHGASLPGTLAGVPTEWLALTHGKHSSVFLAGQRGTLRPVGRGARSRTCFPSEPMAPSRPGVCPLPRHGVSENADKVAQVTLTPGSGVRLRTAPTTGVTGLALHLAPSGDRGDGEVGSPLRVRVRLSDGSHVVVDVAAQQPAVVDRATASVSGSYPIGTVRIALPRSVRAARVVAIKLTGGALTSRFDVRAIDLVQRRSASSGATGG